jgi:hypothetical protein
VSGVWGLWSGVGAVGGVGHGEAQLHLPVSSLPVATARARARPGARGQGANQGAKVMNGLQIPLTY